MNQDPHKPGEAQDTESAAQHGYRSEVNWEGGSARQGESAFGRPRWHGRQPYPNQEPACPGAGAAEEVAEGNRGARSGQTLEQLERVKRRP